MQGSRGHLEGPENWNLDCLLGFEPAKEIFMILETNQFGASDVNICRSINLRCRGRKAEGVMGGGREARGGRVLRGREDGEVGRRKVLGGIEGGILGRRRQVGRLLRI